MTSARRKDMGEDRLGVDAVGAREDFELPIANCRLPIHVVWWLWARPVFSARDELDGSDHSCLRMRGGDVDGAAGGAGYPRSQFQRGREAGDSVAGSVWAVGLHAGRGVVGISA